MNDHPAPQQPAEVVRVDQGGWISGPSLITEPVTTADVRIGDRLLYDAAVVTVTDIRDGLFWLETGHEPGIALGWRSGSASGLIFRKASDLLDRVAGQA
jgi:hypothetical protein